MYNTTHCTMLHDHSDEYSNFFGARFGDISPPYSLMTTPLTHPLIPFVLLSPFLMRTMKHSRAFAYAAYSRVLGLKWLYIITFRSDCPFCVKSVVTRLPRGALRSTDLLGNSSRKTTKAHKYHSQTQEQYKAYRRSIEFHQLQYSTMVSKIVGEPSPP